VGEERYAGTEVQEYSDTEIQRYRSKGNAGRYQGRMYRRSLSTEMSCLLHDSYCAYCNRFSQKYNQATSAAQALPLRLSLMHIEHQLGDASSLSQLQPFSLTYKSLHFPTDQLINLCVADCCYLCTMPSSVHRVHYRFLPRSQAVGNERDRRGRACLGRRSLMLLALSSLIEALG